MGASDASYSCVYQQEDDDGATGTRRNSVAALYRNL